MSFDENKVCGVVLGFSNSEGNDEITKQYKTMDSREQNESKRKDAGKMLYKIKKQIAKRRFYRNYNIFNSSQNSEHTRVEQDYSNSRTSLEPCKPIEFANDRLNSQIISSIVVKRKSDCNKSFAQPNTIGYLNLQTESDTNSKNQMSKSISTSDLQEQITNDDQLK